MSGKVFSDSLPKAKSCLLYVTAAIFVMFMNTNIGENQPMLLYFFHEHTCIYFIVINRYIYMCIYYK